MVEVGGRPILWHIMKTYAHYGVTEFILAAGYKSEIIKDYFLNYEARNNDFTITLGSMHQIEFHDAHLEADWKVTIADTGDETQTAGRLKRVERYLGDDQQFMVTYGDGLADVNISDLVAFHQSHDRIATVTTVQPPSRFGLLEVGTKGTVDEFAEKAAVHGWINGGYFVFDRAVFDYFPDDAMLEQEPLLNLTKDGQLMAWRHNGFWQPMDTFREATMLNQLWASGMAPWRVWSDIDLTTAQRGSLSKEGSRG